MVIPSILWSDKKEWTKEELLNQLKPMCKFKKLLISLIAFMLNSLPLLVFNEDDPEASRDIDSVI